jgi:hypothetical protein
MATLVKTVLGRPKGTVGDVSFRQRNGKNFVVSLPASFNPSEDVDSVARRAKFSFLVRFASGVNSIDPLRQIWGNSSSNGNSAFNQIVSANYKYVTPLTVTNQTFLTPGFGFSISTTALTVSNTGVNAALNPIGTNKGIDLNVEKSAILSIVISLSDPVDDMVDSFYILSHASAAQPLVLDTGMTFAVSFMDQESQIFSKYNTHKALLALVTLDADGNAVHYSGTLMG